MREIPKKLEALYLEACQTRSDINEHLTTLREIANNCEHVTEFGVRGSDGSTLALLAGQPEKLVSWDFNPFAIVNVRNVALLEMLARDDTNRTRWEPRVGSTLSILIEPTDLLFIDTFHSFAQLDAELTRHGDPIAKRVRKYLAFHDTETFGERGEDGSEPGLRLAIRKFQKETAFPQWKVLVDAKNNNGLIVLEAA